MSADTIYLCNFRVSMDGDWLCLKEFADVQLNNPYNQEGHDPMTTERYNLLTVSKLVIKELIDSSLKRGRMIADDHVPLQQFFIIIEHVLRHGIKVKKGILRDKEEFWNVLAEVEKYSPDAADITASVREMPNIKTPLGRSRAWLRLALMQKRLADYFRILIEKKEVILMEHYNEGAMLLCEEGMIFSGLLVGLNVIDCSFSIKDEDLDQPIGVIDFGLYFKDVTKTIQSPDDQPDDKLVAILDQKNYLEELNRHLNATVANLQKNISKLQTANTLMKEDLAIAKNAVVEMQESANYNSAKDKLMIRQQAKQIKELKEELETQKCARKEKEETLKVETSLIAAPKSDNVETLTGARDS